MAMAQNYGARPVTRVGEPESYASMLLLSKVEFIEKLKSGTFTNVQSFCKAMQISAKGGRTKLESRLIDYKDNHDNRNVPTNLDAVQAVSTP